jgi:hypothetical protein
MPPSTAPLRAGTVRILLSVRGGVAEVMHKPRAVEVVIYEYDVEGTDNVDQDHDGRPCNIQTYASQTRIKGPKHWPLVQSAGALASPNNGHAKQR